MSDWSPICICGHHDSYHSNTSGCEKSECKCQAYVRTDVAIARSLSILCQLGDYYIGLMTGQIPMQPNAQGPDEPPPPDLSNLEQFINKEGE